jgi:hypothetical protein
MAVIRAQTFGRTEIELRSGRIDQIIVGNVFRHTGFIGVRVFHRDKGSRTTCHPFRIDRQRTSLMKLHTGLFVNLCKIKGDLFLLHLPDTDPNIRRYPVPLCIRRNHDNLVLLAYQFMQMPGGSVTCNTCA